MKFEVTILGSGAAIPTLSRRPTAQFITCQNKHILIDCGEGTQIQMRKFGVKFQRLNVILISHLHGDHFFGLVGLISTMRLLGRNKNLTIIGPKGLERIISSQLEIAGAKLDFDIDYREIEVTSLELVFEDNVLQIEAFPLKHKIPTSGFIIREKEKERKLKKIAVEDKRVKVEHYPILKRGGDVQLEDGTTLKSEAFTNPPALPKSYAYCSDTTYDSSIVNFISKCNLLYHEATFTDEHRDKAKRTKHSTATDAAKIAKEAKVQQLIMGHLSARYKTVEQHEEEAREIFPNASYVEDGNRYLV